MILAASEADGEREAMCVCGVGGGLHRPDCSVLAARLADDPEASRLDRGVMLTAALRRVGSGATPNAGGARRRVKRS